MYLDWVVSPLRSRLRYHAVPWIRLTPLFADAGFNEDDIGRFAGACHELLGALATIREASSIFVRTPRASPSASGTPSSPATSSVVATEDDALSAAHTVRLLKLLCSVGNAILDAK
jgi:hypothetical protein